jgi:predicted NAD-dependent protein-ADP-ribosyltransferase YbiA (DUF1768 family)
MMKGLLAATILVAGAALPALAQIDRTEGGRYPAHWWTPVPEESRASWEILPQEAGPGEVILSKRHELGLLSNFAPTSFVFRGRRYASLEGLWQSMKYPEGPDDPRLEDPDVEWPHSREEVAAMVSFEANEAGRRADEILDQLGIDWLTWEGEKIRYLGEGQGRHYEIIEAATRAKLRQNPGIRPILLATGDLVLKPDHVTDPEAPPAWRYHEIWMKLRDRLRQLKDDR